MGSLVSIAVAKGGTSGIPVVIMGQSLCTGVVVVDLTNVATRRMSSKRARGELGFEARKVHGNHAASAMFVVRER